MKQVHLLYYPYLDNLHIYVMTLGLFVVGQFALRQIDRHKKKKILTEPNLTETNICFSRRTVLRRKIRARFIIKQS